MRFHSSASRHRCVEGVLKDLGLLQGVTTVTTHRYMQGKDPTTAAGKAYLGMWAVRDAGRSTASIPPLLLLLPLLLLPLLLLPLGPVYLSCCCDMLGSSVSRRIPTGRIWLQSLPSSLGQLAILLHAGVARHGP
jgi:hypothetical protein